MKRRKYLIMIILLLLGNILPMAAWQFVVTPFPTRSSLPAPNIFAIIRDSKGYMWYATANGLCRDNGYQINLFQPQKGKDISGVNNEVRSLAEDSRGNILFGTARGLFVLDTETFGAKELLPDMLSYDYIFTIFVARDSTIWVGSQSGAYHLSQKYAFLESYPMNKPPLFFTYDSQGQLWTLLRHGTPAVYDSSGDNFTSMPWSSPSGPVMMAEDEYAKGFWIGTEGDGVIFYTYDGVTTPQPATIHDDRGSNYLLSVTFDRENGLLWTATTNNVYLYHADGQQLTALTISPSLSESVHSVYQAYADNKGNIFVGGYLPDAFIIAPVNSSIERVTSEAIIQRMGREMIVQWAAREGHNYWWWVYPLGLTLYNDSTGSASFITDNPQGSLRYVERTFRRSLRQPGVYASRGDELHHLTAGAHGDIIDNKLATFNNEKIKVISEDDHQRLWIGTLSAVYTYSLKDGQKRQMADFGAKTLSMALDDHGAFVSVEGQGLFYIKENGGQEKIESPNEIFSVLILDFEGQLLAATSTGDIYRLDASAWRLVKDDAISGGNRGSAVTDMAIDGIGHLWILLADQTVREYSLKSGKSRNIVTDDPRLNVNYFYMLDPPQKLNDGTGIAGSGAYIIAQSQADLDDSENEVPILLSTVVIGERSIPVGAGRKTVDIPAGITTVQLQLTTLTPFTNNIQFAFSLDGGKQYSYLPKGENSVCLYNLKSGNYKLTVKATDENGAWGKAMTLVTIHRLPYWWQTWWARLLMFVILIAAIYALSRYCPGRHIKINNSILTKKGKEQTHE